MALAFGALLALYHGDRFLRPGLWHIGGETHHFCEQNSGVFSPEKHGKTAKTFARLCGGCLRFSTPVAEVEVMLDAFADGQLG